VLAKHEQAAAFMAGGHARITGGVGAGIASAYTDNLPVIAITGEAPTHIFGIGGLQESSGEGGSVNQVLLFAGITRYHKLIERTDYLASVLNQSKYRKHNPRISRESTRKPVVRPASLPLNPPIQPPPGRSRPSATRVHQPLPFTIALARLTDRSPPCPAQLGPATWPCEPMKACLPCQPHPSGGARGAGNRKPSRTGAVSPTCASIFPITAGSSILAMIFIAPPQA
jgi:hypothetical protein